MRGTSYLLTHGRGTQPGLRGQAASNDGPPKIDRGKNKEEKTQGNSLHRMIQSRGQKTGLTPRIEEDPASGSGSDDQARTKVDREPSKSIAEHQSGPKVLKIPGIPSETQRRSLIRLGKMQAEEFSSSLAPVAEHSARVAEHSARGAMESEGSPKRVEKMEKQKKDSIHTAEESPGSLTKVEKQMKDTLSQFDQLRGDHQALRDEADSLRRGLASTSAENKALRRCLEMRGVILSNEFENQYGYTYRSTKGEFSQAAARSGVGREDMRVAAAGRPGLKSTRPGTMSMLQMGTSDLATSSTASSTLKTGRQKQKNLPDFHAEEDQHSHHGDDCPMKREKLKQVKWEVVEKWLKLSVNFIKKSRQDKIDKRPEGDLYILMANILFPRITSHDQRVAFLKELKMSLQRRELICDHWDGPSTPLRYAVMRDHSELVKALLRGKADPDESDKKGISLLHFAVFDNRLEMASALLTWKADPNSTDNLGNTPLFFAPHISICHALWVARANAEMLNQRGQSALHLAAQAGLADVLLWLSAHVSRAVLHHHDSNGAGALYYARQSHIPPATIRKISEAKQSNELIKRQAESIHKEHLPSAVTGHLYMEDYGLDDEPGLFGQIDLLPETEEDNLKNEMMYNSYGGYGGLGSYGMSSDIEQKKQKKKEAEGKKALNQTMLALQDLDRRFKAEEEAKLARRMNLARARDMASKISRETAILYACKKKAKEVERVEDDDGPESEESEEQKPLTPRSARVRMIDMTRLKAAEKCREHARQLRKEREQERKEKTQVTKSKFRLTDIHESLKAVPDASQWRACTVRNMQMELWEVSQSVKSAIESPDSPNTAASESPTVALAKKRVSTSKVHQPVPVQDLYQANRWKAEQRKLDDRMARKMMNDSEAASRIQSAFRRFSLERRGSQVGEEQEDDELQASTRYMEAKKGKDREKVQKLTSERGHAKQQEEVLANDLHKALERLQTETTSATAIQGAFRRYSLTKQEELPNKELEPSRHKDKEKEKSNRKIIPDDSSRDHIGHHHHSHHHHHDKEQDEEKKHHHHHHGEEKKHHHHHHGEEKKHHHHGEEKKHHHQGDEKKHHHHHTEEKKHHRGHHHHGEEKKHHHHRRDHDDHDKEKKQHKKEKKDIEKELDNTENASIASGQKPVSGFMSEEPQSEAMPVPASLKEPEPFDPAKANYSEYDAEKAVVIQSHFRTQLAKKEVTRRRDDRAREVAAVRVQARFRGDRDRRNVQKMMDEGALPVHRPQNDPPDVTEADDSDESEIASTSSKEPEENAIAPSGSSTNLEGSARMSEEEAALTLQKVHRGHMVRRTIQEQANTASDLQGLEIQNKEEPEATMDEEEPDAPPDAAPDAAPEAQPTLQKVRSVQWKEEDSD